MLPVNLTSGLGNPPPEGLQNCEVEPAGHTTIRANPIEFAPKRTVEEAGFGFEHDWKFSGAPWTLSALVVSHGLNAGTSETRTGEAPTGLG